MTVACTAATGDILRKGLAEVVYAVAGATSNIRPSQQNTTVTGMSREPGGVAWYIPLGKAETGMQIDVDLINATV